MKLSEAFELFVAEAGQVTTDQSRASYRRTIRQLIDHSGDKALGSYTAEELTAFCLGLDGRGTAASTINARRTRVRSVFGWLAWRRLVPRDPSIHLNRTVKARGGGVREHHWLNKAETATIATRFNLEDPRGHRDYAVYRTTLMLGLRRSETASLRWSNFRDDLSTVTVLGKGRKLATLSVPQMLRDVLARWRAMEPADAVPFPAFQYITDWASGGRRLVACWEVPLTAAGIYQIVRRYTGVAPHDLRRSFAGILEADGVKLRDVQGLMRHNNLATTDRYLEKSPQRLAQVVETVDWS